MLLKEWKAIVCSWEETLTYLESIGHAKALNILKETRQLTQCWAYAHPFRYVNAYRRQLLSFFGSVFVRSDVKDGTASRYDKLCPVRMGDIKFIQHWS